MPCACADHFHAALDAAEVRQRRQYRCHVDADRVRGGQRRQRVHHVVAAEQRPAHLADVDAVVDDHERAAVFGEQARGPVERGARGGALVGAVAVAFVLRGLRQQAGVEAERFHRRPAAHRQHFGQMPVLAIDDQPAATRHGAHQVVELALDRGHVGEDVGVVVLEVVEDRDQRPVVHELAALVEERGVVLVGLDHELAARADPRRHAEVLGDAADQEARLRGRPPRAARSGSWWWWSCRACRRRRACRGPAAGIRTATARRRCTCGRRRAPARPRRCRATARCRSRSRRSRRRCCRANSPGASAMPSCSSCVDIGG